MPHLENLFAMPANFTLRFIFAITLVLNICCCSNDDYGHGGGLCCNVYFPGARNSKTPKLAKGCHTEEEQKEDRVEKPKFKELEKQAEQ